MGHPSDSDIFAVGQNGTILHYNGSAWIQMDSGTASTLNAVWGSSSSDVYAVGFDSGGSGTILHYDGSSWQEQETGIGSVLNGMWGSSAASDIFAV
jgi:hypothetical protein